MIETVILQSEQIGKILGHRKKNSNKGDHGKGLLLAGSPGFSGAAVMAAASALRSGIGTLKVLCPLSVRGAFFVLPEAMACAFPSENWDHYDEIQLEKLLHASTCVGIGPGIGRADGVERALKAVILSKVPAVIDADGLNVLAQSRSLLERLHRNIVLTPHPGEMSRLCGCSIESVLERPVEFAAEKANEWGCVVLLKGTESVIASPGERIAVNQTGNPGLAKGGSGDVLTGIILAMLGQGLKPYDAACTGAYLLGVSADKAIKLLGERMLMARDVTDVIAVTINGLIGKGTPGKPELRRRIKEQLQTLEKKNIAAQSSAVCERIAGMRAYCDAHTILAYRAMELECDPVRLVRLAKAEGKRVAFPLCVSGNRLKLYIPDDEAAFVTGKYGIWEPDVSRSTPVALDELDLILVPGVAFDKACNRMGHGAGYYDKLLKNTDTLKIGLALDEQIVETVPVDATDIPVDYVITQKCIYCK